MTFPTIHLNGSSAKELVKGYEDAARAVNQAMVMLALTGPHGRDYYPQDQRGREGKTIDEAYIEHCERMGRLRLVYDELVALVQHIVEQDPKVRV